MNDERVCRRCLLLESGKTDILKTVREHIEKISPEEKTESELYKTRIDICSKCDFLEDGTCLKCGCYPEIRAAFGKNRCPYKKW